MPRADLEFLHARHFARCQAVVDKRYPDYCALQLITGGSIDLRYDQQSYRLKGRWVWLCYPGPWIHFECAPDCTYWVHRYAAFRGPLMMQWLESGLLPVEPLRAPGRGDFVGRFDQLLRMIERGDRLGHQRAVNLLEGLLLELADGRRPQRVQWLDRAKQLLLENQAERTSYEQIAAELGMALSTFRRNFRQEAGISVHHFVLQSRVETAKYLLAETRLPVKAIARQLGYRDVFFFSRQFARMTSLPPGQYRARHLDGR